MIDKTVLKRLLDQCDISLYKLMQDSNFLETMLRFANACAAHEKAECVAGEWLKWPENKPELNRFYFVKLDCQDDEFIFDVAMFTGDRWIDNDKIYCEVSSFAEIRG